MGTTCRTLRFKKAQNKTQHIETTNMNHINSCPMKEKYLHYYKELWNNNSFQGHHWNTQNADDKIIKIMRRKKH